MTFMCEEELKRYTEQYAINKSAEHMYIYPSLATKFGINKAVILDSIHRLSQNSRESHDGYNWIRMSLDEWSDRFRWASRETILRDILALERSGVVVSGVYNDSHFDKTKSYRIDYDRLNEIIPEYGVDAVE